MISYSKLSSFVFISLIPSHIHASRRGRQLKGKGYHAVDTCRVNLRLAAKDHDGVLSREAYLDFLARESRGVVNPKQFSSLDVGLIHIFWSTLCEIDPSGCTTTHAVDLAEIFDFVNEDGFAMVDTFCHRVKKYLSRYVFRKIPSLQPSPAPSPTSWPTTYPSTIPSFTPSSNPTNTPTSLPSVSPTNLPSLEPSDYRTVNPSAFPTESPSSKPTFTPTKVPSHEPTPPPTSTPTTTIR